MMCACALVDSFAMANAVEYAGGPQSPENRDAAKRYPKSTTSTRWLLGKQHLQLLSKLNPKTPVNPQLFTNISLNVFSSEVSQGSHKKTRPPTRFQKRTSYPERVEEGRPWSN